MTESNIEKYETSVAEGVPVECYKFSHKGLEYLYTSASEDVELRIEDEEGLTRTEKYFAEHIRRAGIRPGGAGGPKDCVITVSKDHAVAKLFQGPPPESAVSLTVYRLHKPEPGRFDVVLKARIGQAAFQGSECELTAMQENWLSKELPGGMNQYYCNNVIFDQNCGLDRAAHEVTVMIDKVEGLDLYSKDVAAFEDGYFIGGIVFYESYVRTITEHEGERLRIKYPFQGTPHNKVKVLPGCDHLFRTCALRYNNAENFTGVPYVAPTDPEKNPAGRGAYWVDSLVVERDTDGFVGTITL